MTITYHRELIQGSDEWKAQRRGLLTASEMHLIVSPPPKPETRIKKDGEPYKQRVWSPYADNDKCSAHVWELLAQRINEYVEPTYIADAMLRGQIDEIEARDLYSAHFAKVEQVGFVTNDEWGFTLGFSPDGLVGDDGFIECKSRKQKFQTETIATQQMPDDFVMQVQTGFLVTGRKWCDFVTFCGGVPMAVIRVLPNPEIMSGIVIAAIAFEQILAEKMKDYAEGLATLRTIPTERRYEGDMI